MKTLQDLGERAISAIKRKEQICFDLCANTGQMFDNVKHTRWFALAVAYEIARDVKSYQHLETHKAFDQVRYE